MKFRGWIKSLAIGIFFISASNLYAANGDLIVNGNLTVAGKVNGTSITSSPTGTAIPVSGSNARLAWGWKPAFRGALVSATSNQSISSVAPLFFPTIVSFWNNVIYDTDMIYNNANPSRLVVPAGVTKVRISYSVNWDNNQNGAGSRAISLLKNGDGFPGNGGQGWQVQQSGTTLVQVGTTAIINVAGGDYFSLNASNTSGSSINIIGYNAAWFAMEIIE